tara:strand:- start:830 stop:1030 length:201 start_codon:yes stop_codon:yes gene_type:complete
MKEKLSSRKLWVAIGGLLTVIATDWMGLTPEASEQIIGAVVVIVPSYLGGQGIVDALGALSAGKKK